MSRSDASDHNLFPMPHKQSQGGALIRARLFSPRGHYKWEERSGATAATTDGGPTATTRDHKKREEEEEAEEEVTVPALSGKLEHHHLNLLC